MVIPLNSVCTHEEVKDTNAATTSMATTEPVQQPLGNRMKRDKHPSVAVFNYINETLGEITQVKLIIAKKLEKSDTLSDQARLALPKGAIYTDKFLTENEKAKLNMKEEVEVTVVGCNRYQNKLKLSRWDYADGTGYKYVVIGKWCDFVKACGLKKGEMVHVWSFRCKDSKLCMAVVSGITETMKPTFPLPLWGKQLPKTPRVEVFDNK